MSIRSAWLATLLPLGVALALAALAGILSGHFWAALALAALGVLAWHYWRMHTILNHIAARRRIHPPQGPGLWNETERLLARQQDETRTRKQRLTTMLRTYRAAAAALPDAVVVMARKGHRVVWFNEAAQRLLGLHYPRDLGGNLATHLGELSVPDWLSLGRDAEPLMDEQLAFNPGVHLSLKLIHYSDDLWLLIARDVSKLMHLEQMRRDFVANVSHELRTPLTVLHGYLDMMDTEEDPETSRMFAEMRHQSLRMTQLVEDLLTLSRLESQERMPDDHVAMPLMLAVLRREAEALSQGRQAITIEDSAGVDLWGSNKELHSAFSNLIGNAIRYTPAGGRIDVRFAHEGDGAVLNVTDSGYGIPAAHIPRITERFYRVSTSRARETGGTGLGLSIVKHVLNHHDARLEIHSEVGKGSTFSCHFGKERVVPRPAAE
ncbi:phosphate regulon sensor histidine kinase PhoR [Solilutibacter silvestris]|uniref:Phosphate regulon sensor protein PhoR n=1 Tax=Solilutibacter silvestris TaxID=1645665 RepID=A0A2K1PZU1_9GAMM|nr:phosphate regulon sensor histidine kinase PhoR [Lysobacter silvestris]PNS08302.1 phosphate regulon sensor kinase PhoR [Lysobacter silvestris]